MNLIIDVGNSFVKVAVFQLDKIIHQDVFEKELFQKKIKKIKKEFQDCLKVIIGATGKLTFSDISFLERNYSMLRLVHDLKFPFINTYKTPQTLGVDRLALIANASKQFPNKNVLVIDAGTCITFDFLNAENEYLGGAISLGLNMRYKALHHFTEALPLLEKESISNMIGNTTNTCIHSGVVNGVIQEIDGVINQYHNKYDDLTIILTGGDANFLSKPLKSSIFVNSNFLLEGLNYLLNNNLK